MDSNTILVLLDWAMKFTQLKYCEKQADWYAKGGLNWHISTVVSLNDTGKLERTSYAHLFASCAQDWFSRSYQSSKTFWAKSKQKIQL